MAPDPIAISVRYPEADPVTAPNQCFVSYAHHDHDGFCRLHENLKHCAFLFGLKIWHDRRIKAGFHWNATIQEEIEKSQVFVLLTTNDFLGSDYILRHEIPSICNRYKNHNALVLPVIYKECGWRGFFGAYIQAVPTTKKGELLPVRQWPDKEEALAVAVNAISAAISDWFGIEPNSPLAG